MNESPKIEIKTKFGMAVLSLHSATSAHVETLGYYDNKATPWRINNVDIRGSGNLEKNESGVWDWPRGYWPSIKRVGGHWKDQEKISSNLDRKWRDAVLKAVHDWAKTGAAIETHAEAMSLEDDAQRNDERATKLEKEAEKLRQAAAESREKAANLKAAPSFLFEKIEGDKTSGGAGS